LPRQDMASERVPTRLLILWLGMATTALRVRTSFTDRQDRERHGPVFMLFHHFENSSRWRRDAVMFLRFANPQNRVLAAERKQGVTNHRHQVRSSERAPGMIPDAVRPHFQIVRSAASNSGRRLATSARMSKGNSALQGLLCSVKFDFDKPPGKSSEIVREFPVKITILDAFNCTICDLPRIRTLDGRSVMAEASKLDLKEVLFRLSRNRAGLPPINSAAILFSSSSGVDPDVTAHGSRP